MLNVKKTLTKALGSIANINSTIAQILTPTLNTITPLGFYKNVTGGYYRIGNLCIVNIVAYIDGTFAANDYYTMTSNMPIPAASNVALSASTTGASYFRRVGAVVNASGALIVQSGDLPLTYYTVFVSGIYITT